ncbi:hypothetical protein EVAR_54968_1 [Eumeta japonica]|uniref:Uncharacterized protein n=1 Tax=Eumeta variegata TaxID=151549 RepID=A0A4C1YIR9_EUMVA|nr:hypothetical protein EVAR_54968_1 [Eumeta japonica]
MNRQAIRKKRDIAFHRIRNLREISRLQCVTGLLGGHKVSNGGDRDDGGGRWKSGPPELLLTGRMETAEAAISLLHSMLIKNPNFLELRSKMYSRFQSVNGSNSPLLQHQNSINICGISPEQDAV